VGKSSPPRRHPQFIRLGGVRHFLLARNGPIRSLFILSGAKVLGISSLRAGLAMAGCAFDACAATVHCTSYLVFRTKRARPPARRVVCPEQSSLSRNPRGWDGSLP
jgi:hypothetical protein